MVKKVEWYLDFVRPSYRPKSTDLTVLFYFEPSGISKNEAIGRIASESSTGTWTTLHELPKKMKEIQARAFEVSGNFVKIAYPGDLWEPGNAPQLLSGIAGNIFGMKALKNLRLIDVTFPKSYIKDFKGPKHGIAGLRKILKVKKRPITGAVPKPKLGFSAAEHARIAHETWLGGFDLVKDDENLTSQKFNPFLKRVKLMTKMRDKAEKETGDTKDALLNITAETKEMEKRAKILHNYGWRYAMIDVVVSGVSAVQTLRNTLGDYGMAIHAHRAMHASFDRDEKHGITMQFLAKLMRLIGVDQIHSGTTVGKLVGGPKEVHSIADTLRKTNLKQVKGYLLNQNWGNIKPAFPVSSGGLHPGLVPDVIKVFGDDLCLLVSGGIHGHPNGPRSGAKAVMQAIEASHDKISLEQKAKSSPELALALKKWGHIRPK